MKLAKRYNWAVGPVSALHVAIAALALVACGGETRLAQSRAVDGTGSSAGRIEDSGAGDGGGAAGAPSSGGTAATGGAANTNGGAGGVGGNLSSGGTGGVATGGTSGAGGVSAAGSGGTPSTGGVATGGTTSTAARPSCSGLAATCGPNGNESCCATSRVPGGTFPMGRGTEDCTNYPGGCTSGCPSEFSCYTDEQPEHTVTVSAFALDKYEVTVGRFRKFVAAYDGWRGAGHPGAGEGAGLAGTGWQDAWSTDGSLAMDQATLITNLKCDSIYHYQTWTDSEVANETKAMNCVSWYEAFAFCAWDGGRLPTEAEWEYAAAGGNDNRLYPWGSAAPDCAHANVAACSGAVDDAGSSSHSTGAGKWGHLDLAGNVYEWVLDWYDASWYSNAGATGTDVVNLTTAPTRVVLGGYFLNLPERLHSASRYGRTPTNHRYAIGLRCAKTP